MTLEKRRKYNVATCTHGCVTTTAEALLYREKLTDSISQIQNFIKQGYTPVLPSVYRAWYAGTYTPPTPIFIITIDDGLATLTLLADYCVANNYPFGIALISARQNKLFAEEDFISWAQVSAYVATGLCEVMCHTHDQHSLAPILQTDGDFGFTVAATSNTITLDSGASATSNFYNGQNLAITAGTGAGQNVMVKSYHVGTTNKITIVGTWATVPDATSRWNIAPILSSPILDGPCWLDNGLILHRDSGDTRYAWDNSYTSDCFGFPMLGTDPYDGVTPVVSTVTFTPPTSFRLSVIRFVTTLVVPVAGGYDCQVQVKLNGVVCDTVHVLPKNYGFVTQWPEREYVMLDLPNSTQFTNAGVPNTITFTTLNAGSALLRAYFYPGASTHNVSAQTNCQSLDRGLIGPSYADEPAGIPWVGKPLMILGDGTGTVETDTNYTTYVENDVNTFQDNVQKWLNATWTHYRNDPPTTIGTDGVPEYNAIGTFGTFGGTGAVSMAFPLPVMPVGTIVDVIEIKAAGLNRLLDQSPYSCIIRIDTSIDGGSTWQQGYYGLANWGQFKWVQYEVAPFTVSTHTALIRFTTVTASQWGLDVIAQIYLTLPDAIPLTGAYSVAHVAAVAPVDFVYPFGGTYEGQSGLAVLPPTNVEDISPALKTALIGGGCSCGYTITPKRVSLPPEKREPSAAGTEWVFGRQIIYGTNDPATTVQHNNIYAGVQWPDTSHGGVRWQSFIEPNPAGNASIHQTLGMLWEVGFDSYYYNTDTNTINREPLNDGGTYLQFTYLSAINFVPGETITQATSGATATVVWFGIEGMRITGVTGTFVPLKQITAPSGGVAMVDEQGQVTYANDKATLQASGVKCLLLFNNLEFGEPDSDIAHYVIASGDPTDPLSITGSFITQSVSLIVADNWDGYYFDLEGIDITIYPDDGTAATAFCVELSKQLHAVGKEFHMAVPLRTGTAYDIGAEGWWGWCDFTTLIKWCDSMLVMSYLEHDGGTLPGPSCPQKVFDDCYTFMQSVCPQPYWPRIRVGCNMYGQYWPDKTTTTDNSSDDYHTMYADLIYGGTSCTIQDGEATFQDKLGGEGWFGTPLTVIRAVDKAVACGFGGVGLWKLDDGDIHEFLMPWAALARSKKMISESRFPVAQSWFPVGKPQFKTAIAQSEGGQEITASSWGAAPLYEFTLQARDILPTNGGWDMLPDFNNLINFFTCVAQGRANYFRFHYSPDGSVVNQQFAIADGVKVTFQLIKTYVFDGYTYTRVIKKPVPGTVKIYDAGVLKTLGTDYTEDDTTGQISFTYIPTNLHVLTWTGQFDFIVRFSDDKFPAAWDQETGVNGIEDLILIEKR